MLRILPTVNIGSCGTRIASPTFLHADLHCSGRPDTTFSLLAGKHV